MENPPENNETLSQNPPALHSSEKQGSDTESTTQLASGPDPILATKGSPKNRKKILGISCAILLVLVIGISAFFLLNNKNDSASKQSNNQAQESGDDHGQSENQKTGQSPKSNSENSQQSTEETSQGTANNPCVIPYIGELVAEYTDSGELYDCIIPNELVLNAPQSENPLKFVIRPDNNGKLELSTSGDYTGKISNEGNVYTVTISNLDSYKNPDEIADSLRTSAQFIFDKKVITFGIGGYGQAVGAERAFFVTDDGKVSYIGLADIVHGQTELKQFTDMTDVAVLVHGASLEAPDGEHYIGGFTPYAIRSDGFVYGLTGE